MIEMSLVGSEEKSNVCEAEIRILLQIFYGLGFEQIYDNIINNNRNFPNYICSRKMKLILKWFFSLMTLRIDAVFGWFNEIVYSILVF